jgi:hypothetical protein
MTRDCQSPNRSTEQESKLCQAKRAVDGKPCCKPARFAHRFDHPERFPDEYLCGAHARFVRPERLVKL